MKGFWGVHPKLLQQPLEIKCSDLQKGEHFRLEDTE